MAKLKNFTLEGEYFTLIAHLDFKTGKPVIDITTKSEGKIVTGVNDSVLTAIPAKTFDRVAQALGDDIYDLCRLYPSRTLIERFDKDWTEEAEECRDA